ncbi:MAG TPA: carboxypeptidase regulatory-like domain-containing protein [Bryobacteraceae bacterium]|nr:carboxypeptidase regulatory-like domain-containing protein [Bryobacteraceae bacterium]
MPQRVAQPLLTFLTIAIVLAAQAAAQTVTGTVTGTVTDPSGQSIANARVVLTSDRTGESRTATTNDTGDFTLVAIPPGTYSLAVESAGFKALRRTGIVVTANERLALGEVQLSIGTVSESITVTGQAASVQTASAEQSAMLTPDQMSTMMTRGRDVVSLLRLLPGVRYGTDPVALGGSYGTDTPEIGGAPNRTNTMTLDGLLSNDIGTPSVFSAPLSIDAIGEVKALLNNYQAEYAGNGGAVINIVTKSGTRDFHGGAYWYKRHEMFNANSFFNNANNVRKPLYRYNTLGFTLGGPLYIPGKFNAQRQWLFGFLSFEDWRIRDPQALRQVTVPTALERAGDFSQTLDVSGRIIQIRDPLTGQPFLDNRIPAGRINRNGLALLNILPLPNFTDRSISKGNYNYVFQESLEHPKRTILFKVDVVPTEKDRISVRGSKWSAEQRGYAVAGGASNWGLFRQCYCFNEEGLTLSYTRVFSPTVVNEFTAGGRHNRERWHEVGGQPELDKVLRAKRGFTAGQWYPGINAQGVIPRYSFGGVPNSADVSYDDRFLTGGADTTFSFNDNLSVIRGSHSLKAGVAISRIRNYEGEQSTFSGTFAFGRDTNNPLDSNWAYSNALLGNFANYRESTSRYGANMRQSIVEWFAQDNWRATRALTIDYGLRFSWYNNMYATYDGQQALLALDRYDPRKAPALYRPAFGPGNRRMAQNPLTGEFAPAALIGAFVPGSGDPAVGGVLSGDPGYPRGWVDQQPVQVGPRLGIAWDPFGRGKTAVRAGAAVLYNMRVSRWSAASKNPPAVFTPITYNGNLDTFLQSAGVLFPSGTNSFDRNNKTPAIYNLTFGIQHDVGWATLVDVSYVGTLARRLGQTRNLNTLPYGVRFLPQNADPTNPSRPLLDDFLRPMPGYSGITYAENAYSSSYHSLRASANRRFTHGFQFGLAYTYSKMMDYSGIPMYRPLRVWSYGKSGSDQTHAMVLNYMWDVPKASRLWQNVLVRQALDNWQVSGITAFVSGQPSGVGFSTTDGADLSGGGDGTRIIVTGKAQLPHGERRFDRWFDTSVFARPAKGDPGNAPKDVFRGPGHNNWDISLVKRFLLLSESRSLQFRWEMYNAFNHTQFSGVDSTARFDPEGKQVNGRFGQVTSTRSARVMQASLRFTF